MPHKLGILLVHGVGEQPEGGLIMETWRRQRTRS